MEELQQLVTQTGPRGLTPKVHLSQPELVGPSIPLPEGDAEDKRFAEAIRHILPELTKICRYEKRAAGQRDRALGKIMKIAGNANRLRSVERNSLDALLEQSGRGRRS